MANPTYQSGFYAPGRGTAKYPALWDGCVGAWNPGLGNTGLSLRDWSGRGNHATVAGDPATAWGFADGKHAINPTSSTQGTARTGNLIASPSSSGGTWAATCRFTALTPFGAVLSTFGLSSPTMIIRLNGAGTAWQFYFNGGYTDSSFSPSIGVTYTVVAFGSASGSSLFVNNVLAASLGASAYTGTAGSLDIGVGNGAPMVGHVFAAAYYPGLQYQLIEQANYRPGIAYELAPRKFYSLPAAASSRQYRLFRPSILRGA